MKLCWIISSLKKKNTVTAACQYGNKMKALSALYGQAQKFPQRLISRHGDTNWRTRSPDLSAADIFL
jgi:hypothetical protein